MVGELIHISELHPGAIMMSTVGYSGETWEQGAQAEAWQVEGSNREGTRGRECVHAPAFSSGWHVCTELCNLGMCGGSVV